MRAAQGTGGSSGEDEQDVEVPGVAADEALAEKTVEFECASAPCALPPCPTPALPQEYAHMLMAQGRA